MVELSWQVPEVLWYWRGIDVATDELGVPTWVVAPLLGHVRSESDRALASGLADREPAERPEPLRATAHCGEDFVHLLGGLRRVHETLEWICTRPGDRLGHATALGIKPETWREAVQVVWQPWEERLLDLVWEWEVRGRNGGLGPSGRHAEVEAQIRECSNAVFGKDYPPAYIAASVRYLHESLVGAGLGIGYLGFPNGPVLLRPPPAIELPWRMLCDPEVFQRGRRVVEVRIGPSEVEALKALGRWLRGEVLRRNVVVEMNPSSNLLIGDLLDVRDHPVLRLDPPPLPARASHSERRSRLPRLPTCIGSDDPLTFATSLLDEYELLGQVLSGDDPRGVERWLDGLRETGLAARFTLRPPHATLSSLRRDLSSTPLTVYPDR